MPDYVYALHDFLPEHEDEVPFRAGERIEVIEKDDLYGDGWWKGRNLAGREGLFPQSYTAPAPPTADAVGSAPSSSTFTGEGLSSETNTPPTKSMLDPLKEESESGSPQITASPIIAPVPTLPATFFNSNGNGNNMNGDSRVHIRTTSGGDGEVMKATMTDVQKAIEQLGKGRALHEDNDGARSFSFASTRDGADTETDTDFDMSDMDGVEGGEGEGWHKGARRKLAEKARKAIAEAEKLEAISNPRSVAPPIDVELSDESEPEGEDDHHDLTARSTSFPRAHPYIPEEEEESDSKKPSSEDGTAATRGSTTPLNSRLSGEQISIPAREESDPQTATATTTSFLPFTSVSSDQLPPSNSDSTVVQKDTVPKVRPTSASPKAQQIDTSLLKNPEPNRSVTPQRDFLQALPSPTGSAINTSRNGQVGRRGSSPFARSPSPLASMTYPQASQPTQTTGTPTEEKKEKTHPSEWTMEEVVEWLRSKGFDQDVCDKFTEQEITGDVLLELDVTLLKTEIGIMAFGKRMRIANAISDLRRPPSVSYSDHPEQLSPSSPNMSGLSQLQTHSRTQSQSHSHNSYPGMAAGNGHAYSQSMSSSLGSPLGGQISPVTSAGVGGQFVMIGTESPARPGTVVEEEPSGLGLTVSTSNGNANGKPMKGRPSQLSLSPSDGALSLTAKVSSGTSEERETDRGHLSESEAAAPSIRRRLFGRSHDSTGSKEKERDHDRDSKAESTKSDPPKSASRDSKTSQSLSATTIAEKEKEKDGASVNSGRHARTKRSMDGGKGDRLSIFGGTFGPSLGRSRKPPPRYSSDEHVEKSGIFGLPRLHSGSTRKSSSSQSGRPQSPSLPAKESRERVKDAALRDSKEKERDPALLRKRTSSSISGSDAIMATAGGASPLKPGMSVLDQIGEPDHNGWMRKRGDRYNTWKLRYFILKGPHLYCLRSSSKMETKIKGYIHIVGYKVTVDENVDPGRYGFRIDHDHDRTYFFSSEEKSVIRDWMKAIMKATIGRDYARPVISSCNIPTIPLTVAQAMNPAPRPPSPTARDATQKALRRENPHQLSSRDARILMGLPSDSGAKEERTRLDSFFTNEAVDAGEDDNVPPTPRTAKSHSTAVPPRPSREMRRMSSQRTTIQPVDDGLIEWANSHLPASLQIVDPNGSLCGGLALLRLAESIKGRPSSPPVPDSAFPVDATDDKLDGLFRLFDFLLDNDVKMGSVSINDVRQGKRDKIVQLLRALKAWEDKRRVIAQSIGKSAVQAGGYIAPVSWA